MIQPMQYLTSISKYLILAVLSCSLLIALKSSNLEIAESSFTTNADTSVSESESAVPADSIWNSISSEFKLDHKTQSKRVQAEIRGLLADQSKLYQILEASAPYIYYIHEKTQEKGLPSELALIPVIESEFNPNDRSSKKGASGLWQLMSGTANELGVKVKSGYDGRRNVVSSTNAALAYFKDLGSMFNGDWYLAIAAYNCGQGKIQSAVRRSGSRDFWDLPLPRETKCYVPKLLAVAAIIANPAKYGVHLPPVDNQPYFTELKVKKPVNLPQLAKTSDIDIDELRTLNPDYNHGAVPKAKEGVYKVLVPVNKVTLVSNQLQKSNSLKV
jgi:membrane-bound lytic murein transglycosylase D